MNKLLLLKIFVDFFAIIVSWIMAYYIRFHSVLEVYHGIPEPHLYWKIIPFITIIWGGVFFFAGFYKRSQESRSAVREALDILQSCALATVAFLSFSYFYQEYRYSRLTLVVFCALHPILLISGRSALRKLVRFRRRHRQKRKVLLICDPEELQSFIELTKKIYFDPFLISAIIPSSAAQFDTLPPGVPAPYIPPDLNRFLLEENFSCALVSSRLEKIKDSNFEYLMEQVPDVRLVPRLPGRKQPNFAIENVRGNPILRIHSSPLDGSSALFKRLMDIIGASALLLALSPLFAILSALVRLSSPGPIFFRQERMGLDGHSFGCLKFRSMPVDAEAQTGAVFAKAGDNRATWIGKIMRRTSLDEIPQLINVLKGEMSLVGPRPERPVFVSEFRQQVPGYMLRHKVKAGITGWAQVNGWRGDTSIERRIECDLFYIRNWSVWLDVKILFMTIEEVIFSRNAY